MKKLLGIIIMVSLMLVLCFTSNTEASSNDFKKLQLMVEVDTSFRDFYRKAMEDEELRILWQHKWVLYKRKDIENYAITSHIMERYLDRIVELQRYNVTKYHVKELSSVKDFIYIGLDKKYDYSR